MTQEHGRAKDIITFGIDRIAYDGAMALLENQPYGMLLPVERFSIAVAFTGVQADEIAGGSTISLLFPGDKTTGPFFETTWTPKDRCPTPFVLNSIPQKLSLVTFKQSGIEVSSAVNLNVVFDGPTPHFYFYYKGVPTEGVANPIHTCMQGCTACARSKTRGFAGEVTTISEHVDIVKNIFQTKFPEIDLTVQELWLHITTGSGASSQEEADSMITIMQEYRRAGFLKTKFDIYSSLLHADDFPRLYDSGARGFVATIEVVNDELRKKIWGKNGKGAYTYVDHLERLVKARDFFDSVEANVVVGLEPLDDALEGLDQLAQAGVVVVPSIFRAYNNLGYDMVHPDVFVLGLDYFDQIINRIVVNNAKVRPVNPKRQVAIDWINANGGDVSLLPRRRYC